MPQADLEALAALEAEGPRHLRGGARPGAAHHSAKLDDATVRRIRELYAQGGYSYPRIARAIGISVMQVCRIVRRQAWKHVA